MTVWQSLVGQEAAVLALVSAASGKSMTHAWLFTGPPGSGRSNAAIAFAAALQCDSAAQPGVSEQPPGCGECGACRNVLAGAHPDVIVRRTEKVIISVDDARAWVRDAGLTPSMGRWRVIVIEDADRLHERANNALLKAIEEPVPRTVWVLCAPMPEQVLPTIRSRTRHVGLVTPSQQQVAGFLEGLGVAPSVAAHAARVSQGHIGRAKAIALDEGTRSRRREVTALPARLRGLGAALSAAANLDEIAKAEARDQSEHMMSAETANLMSVYGEDRKAKSSRSYRAAEADLKKFQKARERRVIFDVVDRALMDLLSVYRDVLVAQTAAGVELVNEEDREDIEQLARAGTPEQTLAKIEAVYTARQQMMEFNVPVLLSLEALMVGLAS